MLVVHLREFRTRNLIVTQQPEYAFRYSSADVITVELSEWLSYSHANDLLLLLLSRQTFEETCAFLSFPPHQPVESLAGKPPVRSTASTDVKRRHFVPRCASLLERTNQRERVKGPEGLAYIVQGVFRESISEGDHLDRIGKNVALVSLVEVICRHGGDGGAMPGIEQQIESLRDDADFSGESGLLEFLAKTFGRLL